MTQMGMCWDCLDAALSDTVGTVVTMNG